MAQSPRGIEYCAELGRVSSRRESAFSRGPALRNGFRLAQADIGLGRQLQSSLAITFACSHVRQPAVIQRLGLPALRGVDPGGHVVGKIECHEPTLQRNGPIVSRRRHEPIQHRQRLITERIHSRCVLIASTGHDTKSR